MIHNVARTIAKKLSLKQGYNESKQQWLAYSLEILLGKILTNTVILLLSLFLGLFFEALIFLFCFSVLRRYTGGYHAPKNWICTIASLCVCFLSLFSTRWIQGIACTVFVCSTSIFCLLVVFFYAPINHPNMKLTVDEFDELRKRSRLSIVILSGLFLALLFIPIFGKLSVIGATANLNVAVFIVVSKITKQEVVLHEEQKTRNEEKATGEILWKDG